MIFSTLFRFICFLIISISCKAYSNESAVFQSKLEIGIANKVDAQVCSGEKVKKRGEGIVSDLADVGPDVVLKDGSLVCGKSVLKGKITLHSSIIYNTSIIVDFQPSKKNMVNLRRSMLIDSNLSWTDTGRSYLANSLVVSSKSVKDLNGESYLVVSCAIQNASSELKRSVWFKGSKSGVCSIKNSKVHTVLNSQVSDSIIKNDLVSSSVKNSNLNRNYIFNKENLPFVNLLKDPFLGFVSLPVIGEEVEYPIGIQAQDKFTKKVLGPCGYEPGKKINSNFISDSSMVEDGADIKNSTVCGGSVVKSGSSVLASYIFAGSTITSGSVVYASFVHSYKVISSNLFKTYLVAGSDLPFSISGASKLSNVVSIYSDIESSKLEKAVVFKSDLENSDFGRQSPVVSTSFLPREKYENQTMLDFLFSFERRYDYPNIYPPKLIYNVHFVNHNEVFSPAYILSNQENKTDLNKALSIEDIKTEFYHLSEFASIKPSIESFYRTCGFFPSNLDILQTRYEQHTSPNGSKCKFYPKAKQFFYGSHTFTSEVVEYSISLDGLTYEIISKIYPEIKLTGQVVK